MRILLIGDGNSIHLLNYIRVIFGEVDGYNITIFDMNRRENTNQEAYEYYKERKIRVVPNDLFPSKIRLNKMDLPFYLWHLNQKLCRLEDSITALFTM